MVTEENLTPTSTQADPFINWLKEATERFGVTPKMLSVRAGAGKSTVSMLLSGQRKPSRKMVIALAEGLAQGLEPDQVRRLVNAGLQSANFAEERSATDAESGDGEVSQEAISLVLEQLAKHNAEGKLTPEDLADLSSEVNHFAEVRVEHRVRQLQAQGGR